MNPNRIIEKLNRFKIDANALMREVFETEEVKTAIIELNQEQLKDRHVIGDGTAITRIYSSVSQSKFGKPNSEITLYDTGEFYDTMKVRTTDIDAYISGQTLKDGEKGVVDISGYVGGNPMGLDEQSRMKLKPLLQKIYLEKYRQKILAD